MSNRGFFTGRVASAPIFRTGGKSPVCFVTLIRNEYAGKEEAGEAKERKVKLSFTAFGAKARAISDTVIVGDQLFIEYRVQNNDRPMEGGGTEYGFSFVVEVYEFGAQKRALPARFKGLLRP